MAIFARQFSRVLKLQKNRKMKITLVQQTVYFRTAKNIFLLYFSITVFDVSEPFHTKKLTL